MENTAKVGTQKLLFGSFAVRKFCFDRGITNDTSAILAQFMAETRNDTLFAIVQAGIMTQYADEKKPFDLDEYAISKFVDELNGSDVEKKDAVINAFIGSVINKPTDEVPKWLKDAEKRLEEELAKLDADPKPAAETTPQAANSGPTGKKSKSEPTPEA